MSTQAHIFGTRSDLEPGFKRFESEIEVKYARCDLHYGPVYEQHCSLLDWDDLGKNTTGSHITGPCFLLVPRSRKISLEPVPQSTNRLASSPAARQKGLIVSEAGDVSASRVPFDRYLAELEPRRVAHAFGG